MRDSTQGFDRLEQLLLAMHVGDEMHPAEAAKMTGLSEDVCRQMLEGLTRAGLMAGAPDGRFVRRSLDILTT